MLTLLTAAAVAAASPSPKQVLQDVFAAFNRHDAAAVASYYADDAVIISPDFCGEKIGPAFVRENYAGYFGAFPDAHDQVLSMIEQGDTVAVEFVFTGTAGGQKVRTPISSFVTVKNGKIVRDVTYFDVQPTPDCTSKAAEKAK
ncbi:MAG TPA: nuclear transport factor 2 family protein [Allosphingosinicella sp.]|uniref:nuclear transport factor 2 family protein n=1 Tax=Allosphingosinicella sp. TaxID=2823234 RepID=UPI002EDA4E46